MPEKRRQICGFSRPTDKVMGQFFKGDRIYRFTTVRLQGGVVVNL